MGPTLSVILTLPAEFQEDSSVRGSSASTDPPALLLLIIIIFSMAPWSHLLCVLVLLSVLAETLSTPICNNQCCRFVEGFPARLRELRVSFLHIRDFYVSARICSASLLHGGGCIIEETPRSVRSAEDVAAANARTNAVSFPFFLFFCRQPTMIWTLRCWTRQSRTPLRYRTHPTQNESAQDS